MYVCVCRGITDSQIRSAIKEGACSMRDLCKQLGVAGQCGKCTRETRDLLKTNTNCGAACNNQAA